jgi:hypothetical protein
MRRFERLSRLRDFEVARNEPDPRGATVMNRERQTVGKVRDLIVDTDRMRVTYLDVELDTKLFDLHGDDDPHVLVPIERAQSDGRHLIVDELTSSWVRDTNVGRHEYVYDFWKNWWNRGDRNTVEPNRIRDIARDLRPGESARIPLVEEEIIVERRPIVRDAPPYGDASSYDDRMVSREREDRIPRERDERLRNDGR